MYTYIFLKIFKIYIYPPDSQESDKGALHKASNYPDLLWKISRYCCPVEIFHLVFQFCGGMTEM